MTPPDPAVQDADLRALAHEAVRHGDHALADAGECGREADQLAVVDAVLAAVLPAVAAAIEALKDRYHQDLVLDSPADTAAYRAGRQATADAAALVRRLAGTTPPIPSSATLPTRDAPAVGREAPVGQGDAEGHTYLSTACLHGLHDQCRQTCKFCDVGCRCECGHAPAVPEEPATPEPTDCVDCARNVFHDRHTTRAEERASIDRLTAALAEAGPPVISTSEAVAAPGTPDDPDRYDLQAWADLTAQRDGWRKAADEAVAESAQMEAERDRLREILAQRIEAIIELTAERDHWRIQWQAEQAARQDVGRQRDEAIESAANWMHEATRQAGERDKNYTLLAEAQAERDRLADTIRRVREIAAEHTVDCDGCCAYAHSAIVDALSDAGTGQPDSDESAVRVLSWDYREQPDLDQLGRAITDLTGGALHLTNVEDTGSDQYAVVLAAVPLDREQATGAYLAWWNAEQEVPDG